MLFEAFDRIFVINLESRKDRRIEMEEQLSHVGLARDARVRFFSARLPWGILKSPRYPEKPNRETRDGSYLTRRL
jgi:hypothetical protein